MAKSPSFVKFMQCFAAGILAQPLAAVPRLTHSQRQKDRESWGLTVSLTFPSSTLCFLVLSDKVACVFLMPPPPFCAKQAPSLPTVRALLPTHGSGVPNTSLCSRPQTREQDKCLFDGSNRKDFSLGKCEAIQNKA